MKLKISPTKDTKETNSTSLNQTNPGQKCVG